MMLRYQGKAAAYGIHRLAFSVPTISVDVTFQPVTRTILSCRLSLQPDFVWLDSIHGFHQSYWVWIEDPDQSAVLHSEYWTLTKKAVSSY